MSKLAIVIVTWNVRDLALNALKSLFADIENSRLSAEVYVVDNASSDNTADAIAEQFPQVHLTASEENLGFGGGNNYALKQIGFGRANTNDLPDAVYLLNPDTITQVGATKALYDTLMADDKLGLVGAQLANADNSFQHGAFYFPGLRQLWVEFFPTPGRLINTTFNGRYPLTAYQQSEPFSVDFTLGATMMLKREVIQQTDMFDDDTFFMYCEEIDWAWRIRNAGWDIKCVPSAHVTHLVGQSTSQIRPQSLVNLWTSRLRLFKKHYPRWKLFLARKMVMLGIQRKIRQTYRDHHLDQDMRGQLIKAYQEILQLVLE